MSSRRRPPLLPTTLEAALLAIYPATLVLGSVYSLVDPSSRAAQYNALTQSFPQDHPPSYFAKKSNLLNQLFVKQGWAWVTASFFLFLFTHPALGPVNSLVLTPRRIRAGIRWLAVTLLWFFVTQWFFGPAIIDRSFMLTGGQCELVQAADDGRIEMPKGRKVITHLACKAIGGQWQGGHDISGHVFLLVLGSMFLLQETVHVLRRAAMGNEERTITMSDGAVKSAEVEAEVTSGQVANAPWTLSVKIALSVAGMSVFMLAMTAIYFHTWFEKLSGLLVAFLGIFVVYFLPRGVQPLRAVVGLPGL